MYTPKNIKKRRTELKLSQKQLGVRLAKKLEYNWSAKTAETMIGRIERGIRKFSSAEMYAIQDILSETEKLRAAAPNITESGEFIRSTDAPPNQTKPSTTSEDSGNFLKQIDAMGHVEVNSLLEALLSRSEQITLSNLVKHIQQIVTLGELLRKNGFESVLGCHLVDIIVEKLKE